MEGDPNKRTQIINTLNTKSVTKQEVYNNTFEVFNMLKDIRQCPVSKSRIPRPRKIRGPNTDCRRYADIQHAHEHFRIQQGALHLAEPLYETGRKKQLLRHYQYIRLFSRFFQI